MKPAAGRHTAAGVTGGSGVIATPVRQMTSAATAWPTARTPACGARSVRRPDEAADLGKLTRQLAPTVAGIVTGVELAVMAACENQPGIGGVGRKRPDRRVRPIRQRQLSPALAAIGRPLNGARRPRRPVAGVEAGEDLARCAGPDRPAISRGAHRDIMDVGVTEPARYPRPGLAPVETAADAVDLDPGPDDAAVGRIDRKRGDPRHPDIRAFLDHIDRQFPPAAAAIMRTEQRGGPGPGEDGVGVARVKGDLPDVHPVHRRVDMFKAAAAIEALIEAVIGAEKHRARLARMNRHAIDPAFIADPAADPAPTRAAILAGPSAAADGADTDGDVRGHDPLSQPVCEISITTPSGPAHFISKLRWAPGAISMSRPSLAVNCRPSACSIRATASSRSSTSKPKWWMPLKFGPCAPTSGSFSVLKLRIAMLM